MALPEVQVQALDGGLGVQPEGAAGTSAKIGVCSVGGADPIVLSGPQEIRAKLGHGPLANACADAFANGAATIVALRAEVGVAGVIGAQEVDPHLGTGEMEAGGSPYDAFDVLVEVLRDGELNDATFRYSLDGGGSWSDALTVPTEGTYTIPDTGLVLTFTEGVEGPATPAVVLGSAPGPWPLEDGAQLTFSVNGGPDQSVGIQGTAAQVTSSGAAPFALAEGLTMVVRVNGNPADQTITFTNGGSEFVDIAQATLQETIDFINARAVGFLADVDAGTLRLRTVRQGSSAMLETRADGTAHAALGLATDIYSGLGNVSDVSMVSFAELAMLFLGYPTVAATEGAGGVLQIATVATGLAATLQVKAGTHPAFGLDTNLHTGTDAVSGASFREGDTLAFSTTAPQMSPATATEALTVLLASSYRYEFVHVVGPADAAMWAVADTKMAEAEESKRWLHAICEARAPGAAETTDQWADALIAAGIGFGSTRVSVVAGYLPIVDPLTGRLVVRNGAGAYSGRLSGIAIQRSPGRVGDGALKAVTGLWPADLNDGHVEQLDAVGFITFRTFVNTLSAKGVYVTLGRMMAGNTSDYKLVQNRRVMDKALWLVRENALPFLQDEASSADDSPGGLARLESVLQAGLDVMKSAGETVDGTVEVPQGQNILATSTIQVHVRVQPWGYMNFIDADVGFTNPAAA